MTAIWKSGNGFGSPIIKSGFIYNLTEITNKNLMNNERK